MKDKAAALGQAEALLRAGKAAEAARLCRTIRRQWPNDDTLLKLEGIAAYMQGRPGEAAAALSRYVQRVPGDVGGLVNLGNAQQALGQADKAAESFRRALALHPHAAIFFNLGNALFETGDHGGAAEAFGRATALQPGYGKALNGLGLALAALGRGDEAVAAFLRAVAVDPGSAETHTNLGNALQGLGRFEEAVAAHGRAVALRPDFAEAHTNLGSALQDLGQLDAAIAAHRRAVALRPDLARGFNNLGTALFAAARQEEAARCYDAAFAIDPEMRTQRNILAAMLYRDDMDDAALDEGHRRFGGRFAGLAVPPSPADWTAEGPIRVGYLSSDLRDHPVAGNLMAALRHVDAAAFPAYFYATVARPDGVTAGIRDGAAGWCDISHLSDAEAAERIRADGIQILVSLAGRFDENRPTICAYRAAPVQISMHDVATSGLAEMDYLVTDPLLLPRQSREFFTERPLRLPHFHVADLPPDLPPLRPSDGSGGVVFGCFNNPSKITPSVLAVWGRILAALPEARLVLKYQDRYASHEISRHILARLTEAGARTDQVDLVSGSESHAAFLDRYNDIDVALDPFPFSGSTTSFQALTMGVPVVTLPTTRMVSRWTASMLAPLGLGELIATSPDDYARVAVAVAADRDGWRRRRPAIRAALAESPLCDGKRWARCLERLYRAVWRRYLRTVSSRESVARLPARPI